MNAPISSPKTQQSSFLPSTRQSPTSQFVPPPPVQNRASSNTDVFLKDFTLVAEAAKRAQMAVMMRDFEGVGISS
ncbi:hypothetical protein QBC33DRAFT_555376 [Phialemonium atrogriseum]|uniref:Uncharacterized protein n=1 Tax=Phialemonium atrogriseum TaxID=1093897 RepID=A0AAJ0FJR0_9PEZI|nr:uncharacterized protein QBC33DRAFT_555376 [Phialemonium atrogriseum]KAK1770876.1 hypothetical protein QBC33DRAFT_555376 [Phialemonium atrogriseum]